MRLVDLAWQNDPRLHWVSLDAKSAVPAKTSTTQPRFKPRADTLNAVPKVTEEEKRKQDRRRDENWKIRERMMECFKFALGH